MNSDDSPPKMTRKGINMSPSQRSRPKESKHEDEEKETVRALSKQFKPRAVQTVLDASIKPIFHPLTADEPCWCPAWLTWLGRTLTKMERANKSPTKSCRKHTSFLLACHRYNISCTKKQKKTLLTITNNPPKKKQSKTTPNRSVLEWGWPHH